MRDALPFLLPPSKSVVFGPWTTGDGEPLGAQVDGWDPETDLRLSRVVEIDCGLVRSASGLPPSVPLRLATSWRSSSSGIIKGAGLTTVTGSGPQVITATFPGREVGGSLKIVSTLTVGADWSAPAGIASWAGCVLARDEQRLAVEGDAPQFPLEVVDFASAGWDPDASWHLTIKGDPGTPFLGAVWLSINSRDAALLAAIEAPKKSAHQQSLLDAMYADVGDQLVEAAEAAERTARIRDGAWEEETLGAALVVLLDHRGQLPPAPESIGDACDQRTSRQGVVRRMGIGRRFT